MRLAVIDITLAKATPRSTGQARRIAPVQKRTPSILRIKSGSRLSKAAAVAHGSRISIEESNADFHQCKFMAAEGARHGVSQQARKVLLPARNGGHWDDVVNRLVKHGSIHRCVKGFREKQNASP